MLESVFNVLRTYVHYYFGHRVFENYPIICVSHYAANEFCKWLTEKYNADPKRKFKKVIFRLPTESEFIKAASSAYDPKTVPYYPWGFELRDSKGRQLCNYKAIREEYLDYNDSMKKIEYQSNAFLGDWDFTAPVASYPPNRYGLYNIVGNVSEMTQEEGVAMGGDYNSTGYNVRVTSKKKYEKCCSTVGFRVYMEIVEF